MNNETTLTLTPDEFAVRFAPAAQILDATPEERCYPRSLKSASVNKYGVKVGDIFYASWGYEQTNVNFFQIIALVGETSVRIREVYLDLEEEDAFSSMSANRSYALPSEILPAARHASFVDDQKNGDLKRVSNKYGEPTIKVGRTGGYQTIANQYKGETVYESWYY